MCKKTNYFKTSNTHIDKCMRAMIKYLKEDYDVVACCCGHGKYPITVVVESSDEFFELFTNTKIPRKRRFYKKDKQGFYFIPEVLDEKEEI